MSETDRYAEYRPRPLEVIDSTLREGQQTSLLHDHHKYFFTRADKEEILRALIIYGVKFVELFAPVVSPQERDDFCALRAVRDALVTQKGYTFLLAHVRCHRATWNRPRCRGRRSQLISAPRPSRASSTTAAT
jgi:homocitrate synthase